MKRGDPDALRLLGYGLKAAVVVEKVKFKPRTVAIGGRVEMSFVLRSRSKMRQELLVDVAVYFVKADRQAKPKVFKVRRIALSPRGIVELKTSFSLAVHTTRKPKPGKHAVDVIVNGQRQPAGAFNVIPPDG